MNNIIAAGIIAFGIIVGHLAPVAYRDWVDQRNFCELVNVAVGANSYGIELDLGAHMHKFLNHNVDNIAKQVYLARAAVTNPC